jgi:hypothetical protein
MFFYRLPNGFLSACYPVLRAAIYLEPVNTGAL